MELKDLAGHSHSLDVQVLGTEETWNTPSLMLAKSLQSGGKAVFSQVCISSWLANSTLLTLIYSGSSGNESQRVRIGRD